MRSDPRIGLYVSLCIALLAGAWLFAIFAADVSIARMLGMGRHAITYLALIAFFSALVTARMFQTRARLRDDLLAGRGVIASWKADERAWTALAPSTLLFERRQMRQTLWTIWIFIAVIFGGFAMIDWVVAPVMLGVGAGLCVIVGCAYIWGLRLHEQNLAFRDGLVIIGSAGMVANGILHGWAGSRTRLSEVSLYPDGSPPRLEITYAVRQRINTRIERVLLPVAVDDLEAARHVIRVLSAQI